MKRLTTFGLVLYSCLCGCGKQEAPPKSLTPVKIAAAEERSPNAGLRFSASVDANTQVAVAFRVGGYVTEILERREPGGRTHLLRAGDFVTEGTVLARLRQADFENSVSQARAQLAASKAGVAASDAQRQQAEAPLEEASLQFTRAKNLYNVQSLTKPDYDAAKANYDSAEARIQASKAQIESAQANVQTAAAALQSAELALSDSSLKSPLSGTVLQRGIEIGTLASPATSAFVIADTSVVKVNFGVPDTVVHRLRLGEAIPVETAAFPGAVFHGRISSISPAADAKTREFAIEVSVPNPRRELRVGMIASLTLEGAAGTRSPVVVVPLSAIVHSGDRPNGFAVMVVGTEAGKSVAHRRDVQVGESYGSMIAITAGLTAGEQIIVVGAADARDGEPVEVVP